MKQVIVRCNNPGSYDTGIGHQILLSEFADGMLDDRKHSTEHDGTQSIPTITGKRDDGGIEHPAEGKQCRAARRRLMDKTAPGENDLRDEGEDADEEEEVEDGSESGARRRTLRKLKRSNLRQDNSQRK